MISAPDRRRAVELIEEARKSGARLEPACRELGITARTYQRWTRGGQVRTDQRPEVPRPAPANKLSSEERKTVLSACHNPQICQPSSGADRAQIDRSGRLHRLGVELLPDFARG
jgi:transposase-like protein